MCFDLRTGYTHWVNKVVDHVLGRNVLFINRFDEDAQKLVRIMFFKGYSEGGRGGGGQEVDN